MINMTRQLPGPTYLNTPEIQQYINAAVLYMNDPIANPKPVKPANYRGSDLLTAFDRDFHSKCYLTEQKYANSWSMDVEHFIPQVENPSLVYEWTNLFPASAAANSMKPRRTPQGGYLNPCDVADDVETEIICTLEALGENPRFSARNAANVKSVNTCILLNRLHHGHDENTKQLTADLRHAISKKYDEILNKILEWNNAVDAQAKAQAEMELRGLLSRKSSYTKICRSIPAVIRYVPPAFLD